MSQGEQTTAETSSHCKKGIHSACTKLKCLCLCHRGTLDRLIAHYEEQGHPPGIAKRLAETAMRGIQAQQTAALLTADDVKQGRK